MLAYPRMINTMNKCWIIDKDIIIVIQKIINIRLSSSSNLGEGI